MESYSQNYKTFSRQIQKYKNAFLMNNHKNNKALSETERKSETKITNDLKVLIIRSMLWKIKLKNNTRNYTTK